MSTPKIIYFIVSAFRYAVNGGALLHKGGVCNAVAFVAFVAETYDYGKRMNDYGK